MPSDVRDVDGFSQGSHSMNHQKTKNLKPEWLAVPAVPVAGYDEAGSSEGLRRAKRLASLGATGS